MKSSFESTVRKREFYLFSIIICVKIQTLSIQSLSFHLQPRISFAESVEQDQSVYAAGNFFLD